MVAVNHMNHDVAEVNGPMLPGSFLNEKEPGYEDIALGHTGARALATGGCAPPVQALLKIIGAECTVINRELGAKSTQRC